MQFPGFLGLSVTHVYEPQVKELCSKKNITTNFIIAELRWSRACINFACFASAIIVPDPGLRNAGLTDGEIKTNGGKESVLFESYTKHQKMYENTEKKKDLSVNIEHSVYCCPFLVFSGMCPK